MDHQGELDNASASVLSWKQWRLEIARGVGESIETFENGNEAA